jgi:hypothetical protein
MSAAELSALEIDAEYARRHPIDAEYARQVVIRFSDGTCYLCSDWSLSDAENATLMKRALVEVKRRAGRVPAIRYEQRARRPEDVLTV